MNTIIEKIIAEIERLYNDKAYSEDRWDLGYDCACEDILSFLSDLEKEEKPMNPSCESKFKVGDRIQFKGFGHNKYTIAKVEDNRYVDTSGNGMDMSYTDANFELVKEQPVGEGLEEEMIAWHKEHFKGKRKWEETSGEYLEHSSQLDLARHFYELGRQSKPRIVFSKEVFDQYDREQFINAYKPKVSEGFEEEIDRLWNSFADEMEGPHNLFDVYARLARHFAQWGAEHLKK